MKGQLYIPDISGFSKFVYETDLLHGLEITVQLLKTIITSNYLDLEIYEIEGDAVVFVNFNEKRKPFEYFRNSVMILSEFYKETRSLDSERKCKCNACSSIVNLGLKFIVHEDDLSRIEILNYKKLYGRALIIVHRLLKNKIKMKDYLMLTENYLNNYSQENLEKLINYSHDDPILGKIKTKYLELKVM